MAVLIGKACCLGDFSCCTCWRLSDAGNLAQRCSKPPAKRIGAEPGFVLCTTAGTLYIVQCSKHAQTGLVVHQDTRSAHFTNAILGLKKYQTSRELWVPCDPLAFAVAFHEQLVLKSQDVFCSVETADAKTRGRTSFLGEEAVHAVGKAGGVVCKVDAVDVDMFAKLLDQATDVERTS